MAQMVWLFELAFVNGLTGGCTIIIVQCLWHLWALHGAFRAILVALLSRWFWCHCSSKIFWNSFFTVVHSIFLFRHLNWVVLWIFHILDVSTGYLWVGLWSWCLQQGVRLFLGWAVMQGVAMLLQNRYQRQRLYTRIALGKVYFPCSLV
jgi:hypothetical protein